MITLNHKNNVYEKDGFEYSRLSTILQKVGIIDPTWYTEEGARRGTYVHTACALFDQNVLDWKTVDHRIDGYVNAWAQFRKDSADRFNFIYIEKKIWSNQIKVAGTTDRIAFEGKRPAILDIKTGDSNFVGIQTAGYSSMMSSISEDPSTKNTFLNSISNRYAIKLNENGTYRLKPLVDPSDYSLWHSAVNVYRFNNPIRRIK